MHFPMLCAPSKNQMTQLHSLTAILALPLLHGFILSVYLPAHTHFPTLHAQHS